MNIKYYKYFISIIFLIMFFVSIFISMYFLKKPNNDLNKKISNTESNIKNQFTLGEKSLFTKTNDLKLLDLNEMSTIKKDILRLLYLNDYESTVNKAETIINEYKIDDESFIIFLNECMNFKNYNNIINQEKVNILRKTESPELILYQYLNLDIETRNTITKNKQSKIIFNKNIMLDGNLTYIGNYEAGLYSEMDINNAFYTVPKNIKGYKIKFYLNNDNCNLFYIKYDKNNLIDIILYDNYNNSYIQKIKEYNLN